MIALTAREALDPRVARVTTTMRPVELAEPARRMGLYAVFDDESGRFLRLVPAQDATPFPHRIFADLLPKSPPAPVVADASLDAVSDRMATEGMEALPVLDEQGGFLGVITRPSLLESLLRREGELLAEAGRLQERLEAEQQRLVAWSKRLEELNEASRTLLGLVGQTAVERGLMQEGLQALVTLLQARYGAIGLLDETGRLQQFTFAGITAEEADRIGELPQGRGLLGVVIRENQVLRLQDLTQDPRHAGFPPNHPLMKPFLAVPISHQGQVYGRVYVCDKTTGEPFTEEDERLTVSFARSLALALAHARELAERQRAEAALRESEAKWRSLVENAPDIIFTVDCAGTILFINRTPAGLTVEEALGTNALDYVVPEYREVVRQAIRRVFESGESGEYEIAARGPHDTTSWYATRLGPVRRDGEVVAATLITRDITERKRAQEALQESALWLRGIFDSQQDAVFVVTPDRRLLNMNAAAERMVGYSLEEVKGLSTEVLHVDRQHYIEFGEHIRDAFARGELARFEFHLKQKNGEIFPTEHTVSLLRNMVGEPVGIVSVARDITERKRMEEALRETEQKHRLVLDHVDEIVYMVRITEDDPYGGTVQLVSNRVKNLLGYHPEEFLADPGLWFGAVHPEDIPALKESTQDILATKNVGTRIYRLRHKETGEYRWMEDRVRPQLDDAGNLIGIFGVARDVTERKRAAEALVKRTEQLETIRLISQEITRELHVPTLLQLITRRAAGLVGTTSGVIYLWDEAAQVLNPQAWLGLGDWFKDVRLRLGEGVAGLIAERRTGIFINDYRSWPAAVRLVLAHCGITAVLGEPLLYQDHLLGVITVNNEGLARPFTEGDREILSLFATQAAIAIENARLFEQVRAGRERLRALSRRLVEVQEAERRHLARELHDEIGQVLTGLKLSLEMSKRLAAGKVRASLGEAERLVSDLMVQVRELSLALRPAMLDDLGLLPALLWHIERYTATTRVQAAFEHTGLEGRFPSDVETAAYRIAQEALTNVARHAGVSEVKVRLWADAATLGLQIEDRGTGFDPGAVLAAGTSGGLFGMRERAVLLGGDLRVESAPGGGTRVTAELPVGGARERRKRGR